MTERRDNLLAKYLAGDMNADEAEQLRQSITDDPNAADELLSEAFMDVHLREILSGSALDAAVAKQHRPSDADSRRSLSFHWATAAMLFVAISGWMVAAYVFSQLGEARTDVNTLKNRLAELEADSTEPSIAVAENVPQIHSVRGLLMTMPQEEDERLDEPQEIGTSSEAQLLLVGTTPPLDQRLWTCPWGATEFRYDSGVSISVERNTAVKFNETKGQRQLTLERGIVHVTNLSKTDKQRTEIRCPLATVRLFRGQVAVQVDRQQTAIEAAVNQVKVVVEEDGVSRTLTVRRGQYLIITPGEKAKVTQGMLKLGLEPPSA